MWTKKEQQVFDKLKVKFTTAPILAYLENNVKYHFECNTSDFATGAVLSLKNKRGWHLVTFFLHSIFLKQCNYTIVDKKMLEIIYTSGQWRHHLEEAKYQFKIWSDHANLQYFIKFQDFNWKQACLAQYLLCFNYVLIKKPSSQWIKLMLFHTKKFILLELKMSIKGWL